MIEAKPGERFEIEKASNGYIIRYDMAKNETVRSVVVVSSLAELFRWLAFRLEASYVDELGLRR